MSTMDYSHTSERKTVSTVAGVTLTKGQQVFINTGSIPVIVNRSGSRVTSVTVLSDASRTGKAVHRLAPSAVLIP